MSITNDIVINQYILTVFIFSIIFFVMIFAVRQLNKEKQTVEKIKVKKTKRSFAKRARQSTESVKTQIEKAVSAKADVKKKYKIETLCMQAGFDYTYGEYILLCISVAIAFPILMLLVMKNVYLAVIFGIIGFKAPGEYFKAMANKRIAKLDDQIGSLLRMVIERYKSNRDIAKSLTQSLADFKGLDPMYEILEASISDLQIGIPIDEVLDKMVRKTGNKYLARFADYYKIADTLGTHEDKIDLLSQAYAQYKEYCDMKQMLKEKISGPVREAYIMVIATPAFMVYQAIASEGYIDFMINNPVGQIGIAVIITTLLLCIWFINAKIGAPIDM